MLSVIGAIGQVERAAMLEPQLEGIAKAKLKVATRVVCRAPSDRLPTIIRLKSEGVRPAEIARKLGIGRASVYRVRDPRYRVSRRLLSGPRHVPRSPRCRENRRRLPADGRPPGRCLLPSGH
jgi:hypothetical protein